MDIDGIGFYGSWRSFAKSMRTYLSYIAFVHKAKERCSGIGSLQLEMRLGEHLGVSQRTKTGLTV